MSSFTRIAVVVAAALAACGGPSTPDGGMDATGGDGATADRPNPTDTGVRPDTGVVTDTGVDPDTGVVTDTGVATDAMSQPDATPDVTCTAPSMACGGSCVDITADSLNCGACGNMCPAGQSCRMSACTPDCVLPNVVCGMGAGSMCVNPQTDNANCGACGNACGAMQTCTAGACTCPMGRTACGMGATATCVDAQSDVANCGACGNACAMGQVCQMGACITPCLAPRTMCGMACTNTQTDSANCGACGTACGVGQTCVAGACACPMGQTRCGVGAMSYCASTQTDTANCGACGTTCAAGATCTAGACACAAGETVCGAGMAARCVNRQTDAANCGTCGNACAAGSVCITGMCTAMCSAPNTLCGVGAMATCTNHQTDNANCGACGNNCGSNGPCMTGQCRPLNNSTATPIPLAVTLTGARVSATGNNQNGATAAGQCAQRAVYYSVTFTQPAIVYVDTFGSALNTVVGVRPMGAAATTACNDNSCAGNQSQTVAVVPAGTSLIEVSGNAGATGLFTVNVAALPAAGGTNNLLAPDSEARVLRGETLAANMNRVNFGCAGNSTGSEDAYYFTTCPSAMAANLQLNTCRSEFDTAVEVRSGGRATAATVTCDDDTGSSAAIGCSVGLTSHLSHAIPAGAGLNVAYVGGFNANFGTYTLNYTLSCGSNTVACGASCRSINTFATDAANCGQCGRACPMGMACAAGVCGAAAAPATIFPAREGAEAASAVVPGGAAASLDRCPDGTALVGLRMQNVAAAGTRQLSSVAALCAPVSLAGTSGTGPQRLVFGAATALAPRGTTAGATAPVDFVCPTNHIVVGFTPRSGAQVDMLAVRCAPVTVSATAPYTTTVGTPITIGAGGGSGGGPGTITSCAAGTIATGIGTRTGSGLIDGFGLLCHRHRAIEVTINSAMVMNQALVGGGGGGAFSDPCPAGNVLVGVEGDYSPMFAALGQLRGVCRPVIGVRGTGPWTLALGADAQLTNRGMPGGMMFARSTCNTNNGMSNAFIDARTTPGNFISRVQVRCSSVGATAALATQITATAETPALGVASATQTRACPANTIATTLLGRSGAAIDALSFGCSPVTMR